MQAPPSPPGAVVNRLRAVLIHVPFYSIEGASRLAQDCQVSPSTISRLLSGKSNPSFGLAQRVADAISNRMGKPILPQEIFCREGAFLTRSACELMGCKGCFPPQAWNERTDTLRPEWKHKKPGEWSAVEASPLHTDTISIAAPGE